MTNDRVARVLLAVGTPVVIVAALAFALFIPLPPELVEKKAWGADWLARIGLGLVFGFFANYVLTVIVNQSVRMLAPTKAALWSFEWSVPPPSVADIVAAARELNGHMDEAIQVARETARRLEEAEERLERLEARVSPGGP